MLQFMLPRLMSTAMTTGLSVLVVTFELQQNLLTGRWWSNAATAPVDRPRSNDDPLRRVRTDDSVSSVLRATRPANDDRAFSAGSARTS
jgi:hypothetical protein